MHRYPREKTPWNNSRKRPQTEDHEFPNWNGIMSIKKKKKTKTDPNKGIHILANFRNIEEINLRS